MYSYKGKDIIQDNPKPKKSFKEKVKEAYGNTMNIFHILMDKIINGCKNIRYYYYTWNIDKGLEKLLWLIRALWLLVLYLFPLILLLYVITQVGLFTSTRIFPIFDKDLSWGWNDKFIHSLPLIFQPSKYPFGQFVSTVVVGVFAYMCIHGLMMGEKQSWKLQLPIDIVIGIFMYLMFLYPTEISRYFGMGFLVFIIGTVLYAIFTNSDSESCGGGGIPSEDDYDDEDDDYNSRRIDNHREETYEPHIPVKENRYIRVRQMKNSVMADYWEFVDGKKGSHGGSRSYMGNLVTWSSNMVTTNFNGLVRTYDENGMQISCYKEY